MNLRRFVLGLAVIGLATGASASAHAQLKNAPLNLQVFRPAVDSKGFITLNASQILAPLDFSFGLVSTWAHEPLVLEGTVAGMNSRFSVDHLLTSSFQGAVGLIGGKGNLGIQVGLVLPVGVLYGKGTPKDPMNPLDINDDREYTADAQGLGDLEIHPKIRFLNTSRHKVGLSVIPSLILPTGDDGKFLGEGQFIFQPTAVIDVEPGRPGVFRAAVNVGLRMRTGGESQFIDDAASFPRPVGGIARNTGEGVSVGNELLAGVGVSIGVVPNRFDIVGELYTFTGLDSKDLPSGEKMGTGGEAVAGIKLYLARNSFFMLGGGFGVIPTSYGTTKPRAFVGFIFEPSIGDRDGDGLKDDVDLCPDDPEDFDDFEDEDGCPEPDNDKDGILDKDDLCPNDPEDKDGFEDKDGCPDPDNDKDRILDVNDKCPNEPETYNGTDDDDGCPDKGKVIVRKGKLEILDKIYFETDKAEIKPISFPLLDAIAATIKGNPQIQLLEIQGHADERGADDHNLDLTDRRAHSVMRAMEERGVEPGRLKARGYGETRPICTGHNEGCWSQNRRVEFIILRRADEATFQGGEGQ